MSGTTSINCSLPRLEPCKRRHFYRSFATAGTVYALTTVSSVSLTQAAGVIVLTGVSAIAPFAKAGDVIVISGASDTNYNTSFTVVSATSSTIPVAGLAGWSTSQSSLTVVLKLPFRKAMLWGKSDARTSNTSTIYFGSESTASTSGNGNEVQAASAYEVTAPTGGKEDLADFYFEPTNNADGIYISFL